MASSESNTHSDPPPPPSLTAERIMQRLHSYAARYPPSHRRKVVAFVSVRQGLIKFVERSTDTERLFEKMLDLRRIKAIPIVKVEEQGIECSICLSEFDLGGSAKKMPCNHRFHPSCINKWLWIRGECPICRRKLPEVEVDRDAQSIEAAGLVFEVILMPYDHSDWDESDLHSNSGSDSEMETEENPGISDSSSGVETNGDQ